jgi:DMSO/TMAO reductase YedYZ heme-binding membrane subunit
MILAALDPKLTWYAARASGLVSWSLVTASIVVGLALSTRLVRRRGASAWLLDLHRFLGTLSLVFVAVHVLALWGDNYVHFGPRELFVPMASTTYRPGAVAWGVVAMYLMVAIQLTSWAMQKMPRRLWHTIHLSSFVLFASATVHGFTAGADNTNLALQWGALTGGLLVLFLLVFRLLATRRRGAVRSATLERATAA